MFWWEHPTSPGPGNWPECAWKSQRIDSTDESSFPFSFWLWRTEDNGERQFLSHAKPSSLRMFLNAYITGAIFLLQLLRCFSSVQSLSCVRFFVTPWTAAHQASLSITNSCSLPKPMSIESMMPYSHLILCCPLLLPPSIFPSIMVFSSESTLHMRWPKYWSFSFNISPSNEHPGLISFRMDWLDLPAVQGTIKSLLQHISTSQKPIFLDRLSFFFLILKKEQREMLGL